jgi:HAD superfamily hydrolase (TIGR01509 family)
LQPSSPQTGSPRPRRKAAFFDLDGTIADSLGLMRDVYRRFVAMHGGAPSDEEFDRLNGVPLAKVLEILREAHAIAAPAERLLAGYREVVDRTYLDVLPFADAARVLGELHSGGWYLALVTSNGRARSSTWLGRHDLARWFDTLVCAEDVKLGKPHPEPFLTALGRSGLAAGQAVAIDDSPLGIESALAAGIRPIVVGEAAQNGNWGKEVLRASDLSQVFDVLVRHEI